MIPLDTPLVAPPGHLLVEREEMPLKRGRLHLPPNMRFSTRANEAVVLSVGAGLEYAWGVGEHVYLSNAVGRPIKLGAREERTVYKITPSVVLARIVGELDEPVENEGEAMPAIPQWEIDERAKVGAGEPEALR